VYGTTESLVRTALTAKSWVDAVGVDWGSSTFTKADVSTEAQKGVGRDDLVTAFIKYSRQCALNKAPSTSE